jgi:hypothetical protein
MKRIISLIGSGVDFNVSFLDRQQHFDGPAVTGLNGFNKIAPRV